VSDYKLALNALIKILENPKTKKGYIDLKKYYESICRKNEVKAIEFLISQRFEVADSTSSDKE
jgi:hypothetical protein